MSLLQIIQSFSITEGFFLFIFILGYVYRDDESARKFTHWLLLNVFWHVLLLVFMLISFIFNITYFMVLLIFGLIIVILLLILPVEFKKMLAILCMFVYIRIYKKIIAKLLSFL